jgi:hypothetical protein
MITPNSAHGGPDKGLSVSITEAEIATLVDAFYAKVREDVTLGPIFQRHY